MCLGPGRAAYSGVESASAASYFFSFKSGISSSLSGTP